MLIRVVKWWPWAHEGWSVLPGDEASDSQHQLQTVRPPRHFSLRVEWGQSGLGQLWICVYIFVCRESCQRGWRLLYILTAFHRCSDVMKPFLLKFLQDACTSPTMQYQGRQTTNNSTCHTCQVWNFQVLISCLSWLTAIAKACEQNLRRTFQYGGRVQYPNNMELKAMLVSL